MRLLTLLLLAIFLLIANKNNLDNTNILNNLQNNQLHFDLNNKKHNFLFTLILAIKHSVCEILSTILWK